ncbi:hypothetical protein BDV97DRAFT_403213 [Delphinella strobiligena]|nr:hypothetical protein BDV97DRAFT_403213 [Delphinella strobiligena]
MGIPEDHEAPPSPTTQDMANKERLPLYSEPHHTSPGEPQQPQDRATPDEVRDFLGTGRELASYSPIMYCDVFGFEDGWIVYKEVKLFIANEKNKKFSHRHGPKILIACLIVLEIAMISMVWFHPDQPALVILGIVIGLPGFAALVALSCVTLFGGTPEETIESELRDGLKEARKP